MATNYPGALDALTNPTATDNMATVSHSSQHANANDAIEAIQAELGINPSGSESTVVDRLSAVDTSISAKVTGPGSATSGNVVVFDGTSGKLVRDSGAALSLGGALTLSGSITASAMAGPLLSTVTPAMNGTATYGNTDIPARQDHVHPSDTTKVDKPTGVADSTLVRFSGTGGSIQSSVVTVSSGGNISGVGSLTTSGDITTTADLDVSGVSSLGDDVTVAGDVSVSGSVTAATVLLGSLKVLHGTGTPESNVTAPVGSLYLRSDGGAGTTLYVKETGTGNTGWAAK